jgi:hypothetical protein
MRAIRFFLLTGVMSAFFALGYSEQSSALVTASPPDDYRSPVFITAFQLSPISPDEANLNVVELFNETDQPINLKDWKATMYVDDQPICEIILAEEDVYIPPEGYVVVAEQSVFGGANENIAEFVTPCSIPLSGNQKLLLESTDQVEETINGILNGAYVRKGLTATYRDEDDAFTDNFSSITTREGSAIYAGSWYYVEAATPVQIVEIVPRARTCSPIDKALDCSDYVKLYNPTSEVVSLDRLRLRIGYKEQNVTTANAIVLAGSIAPNSYGVIAKKLSTDSLSISDGGGWIWLEDMYGIKRYDNSVVSYPSASSVTKIGWAWAYDERDGEWKWTSTTSPYNRSSRFTLPVEEPGKSTASTLTPCRDEQYRSLETNRCRLISGSSSSSPKPCAANQYRNLETNRCRSTVSAASSRKPCAVGQERNPATNRCRKATAGSIPSADFPVETIKSQTGESVGWLAFAGVGSMAAGYGAWEWRREVSGLFAKVVGGWKK